MTTMALVPIFLVLLLAVRGAPVFLYRNDLGKEQRLPFALSAAVTSLSIVVVVTEIGLRLGTMNPDVAAALIGAALLSVVLFPTVASILLSRKGSSRAAAEKRAMKRWSGTLVEIAKPDRCVPETSRAVPVISPC
jgi:hypothetical protein